MPGMHRLTCLVSVVLLFLTAVSCGKDKKGGPAPQTSPFVGTFSGEVTVSQESSAFTDGINLSIRGGSPLTGSFFRRSQGVAVDVTVRPEGNTAAINGTRSGACATTYSGTLILSGVAGVSLDMTEAGCEGNVALSGRLHAAPCVDVGGTYDVEETTTITVSAGGQSETQTVSGNARILLEQNECQVSYPVPGAGLERQGAVHGNTLDLSGTFVNPLVEGMSFRVNEFHASVTIKDEFDYTFVGTGNARGTYQGVSFTITGSSTGRMRRHFDVAVAVLRGGAVGPFLPGSDVDRIRAQAEAVDPKRVIAEGFVAAPLPDQLTRVGWWLNRISQSGSSGVNLVLIGHSLGGDAVRRANFANTRLRITLDPINADSLPPNRLVPLLDQRAYSFAPTRPGGRFLNILSSTLEGGSGIFGHLITGASENRVLGPPQWQETNHFTIVTRVVESNLVANEVRALLNAGALPAVSDFGRRTLSNQPAVLRGAAEICTGVIVGR
jgi:hypothetical protein